MTFDTVIHCTPSLLPKIKELGYKWSYSKEYGEEEIDIFVKDIPYDDENDDLDPEEQLCDYYELDFNYINSIEPYDEEKYEDEKNNLNEGERKELEELVAMYTKKIESNPNNYIACYKRGIEFLKLADHESANRDFDKVINYLDGNSKTAEDYYYHGLAIIERFTASNGWREAIACFSKAIEIDPNHSDAYRSLGSFRKILDGDDEGAIKDYTKGIDLSPNDAHLYRLRGETRKDPKGKMEDLNKSIEIDPHPYAYISRSQLKENSFDDIKGAMEDLDKAIDLDPQNIYALMCRGYKRVETGNIKGACEDWVKASELGEPDADEMLEEYATGNYQSYDYYMERGQVNFKLGNNELAIEDYSKAINLDPYNYLPYSLRGNAKIDSEDLKGACEDWKKAAELGSVFATELLKKHCQ